MKKFITASIIAISMSASVAFSAPCKGTENYYKGVQMDVVYGGSSQTTDVLVTIQSHNVLSAKMFGASWQFKGDDMKADVNKLQEVQEMLNDHKGYLCVQKLDSGEVEVYEYRAKTSVAEKVQKLVSN